MNGRTVMELDWWLDEQEEDDAIYFTEQYHQYYAAFEGETQVTHTSTNGEPMTYGEEAENN